MSPVGLSLVTKVAPVRILSMMMGVWLATSFIGGFLAGWLGSFWSRMEKPEFFLMIAAIAALRQRGDLRLSLVPARRAAGIVRDRSAARFLRSSHRKKVRRAMTCFASPGHAGGGRCTRLSVSRSFRPVRVTRHYFEPHTLFARHTLIDAPRANIWYAGAPLRSRSHGGTMP